MRRTKKKGYSEFNDKKRVARTGFPHAFSCGVSQCGGDAGTVYDV